MNNGQAYSYITMGTIILEGQWLPLNHTSKLLYITLFMMIKVDISFLTEQFLNTDLHSSIYMNLILMNKPPIYEDVFNEIHVSPNDTKLLEETSIWTLTQRKINYEAMPDYIRLPDKQSLIIWKIMT